MGCHIIDPVVWSLDLGAPLRVWSEGPPTNGETYPAWEIIRYEFGRTSYTTGETILMTWYDGGKLPPRNLVPLPVDEKTPTNGCLLIGEKGTLLCEHGRTPMLLPLEKFEQTPLPNAESDDHYLQWTKACKGEGKATSHFDYAGPLTETVLLGTIAIRFPNQKLEWDSENLKVTNVAAANQHVRSAYRKGWEVQGLS